MGKFTTYHGDGERVDVFDIQHAVLPGDQALHVDVQLVPDGQDGLVVLLVPSGDNKDVIHHLQSLNKEQSLSRRGIRCVFRLTCWPD